MSKNRGAIMDKLPDGIRIEAISRRDGFRLRELLRRDEFIAVRYDGADGRAHWVTSDENETIARANITSENATVTVIPHSRFRDVAPSLISAIVTPPALRLMTMLAQLRVPAMTPKAAEIIRGESTEIGTHYRATIADMYYKRDMSHVNALVLVKREKGDTTPVTLPSYIEGEWIDRTWFGFKDVGIALSAKLAFPQSILIEL